MLRAGAQDTIRFEVPPEALTKYLKTMKVSGDIKKMDAHIADGKMVLDGKIGIPFGGIDFKATMVNGPDGKLVIEGVPTITYHGAANFGPVKEKAQATITNIDNKITEEIQSKADSNWDVASTQIVGDKLALEFKKK